MRDIYNIYTYTVSTISTHYLQYLLTIYNIYTVSSSFNRCAPYLHFPPRAEGEHNCEQFNDSMGSCRHCEAEVKSLLYFHCDKLSQIDKMGLWPRAQLGLTPSRRNCIIVLWSSGQGRPFGLDIVNIRKGRPSVLVTTLFIIVLSVVSCIFRNNFKIF